MTGQYSEERFTNSSESEATDKPVYNSEVESNSPVDEAMEYESENIETESDEVYIEPDLTVEPLSEDVTTWKPIPAVEVMAKAEAIETPVQEMTTAASYLNVKPESTTNLLLREDSEHFRTRWNEIQGKFVDEPRDAVQQADALVSEVVDQITRMFAAEHGTLEGQWKQGNDVSTEDLRKALQHYRAFFNRLVG